MAGSGRRMIRLRPARILTAVIVLIVAAVAGIALFLPAAVAIVCPACYGFYELAPHVFVERGMSEATRSKTTTALADARRAVGDFFGDPAPNPRVLICASEACYHRLGGHGSRGKAYSDTALVLSPRGIDPVIAAHELAHIAFHHRVGLLAMVTGAVPAWFDEGLAVTVSDDRRYLAPPQAADRCLVASDAPLPATRRAWGRAAGADHELYAKAACRVVTWLAANGGAPAVLRLADAVAAGRPFAEAYR
jgi:hypothetical protein